MRITTFFSVLSLVVAAMAIHLGDGSNLLWADRSDENSWGMIGILFGLALLCGVVVLGFWLFMMYGTHGDDKDAAAFQVLMGLVSILVVFCFSYLYGFAVAPFSNESAWLSGWLIFVVIGLLPVMLNSNDSITGMIERRRQRPAGEDKVRSIR